MTFDEICRVMFPRHCQGLNDIASFCEIATRELLLRMVDEAIATAGKTDHSLSLSLIEAEECVHAVLAELHRDLVRMKGHVLAGLRA